MRWQMSPDTPESINFGTVGSREVVSIDDPDNNHFQKVQVHGKDRKKIAAAICEFLNQRFPHPRAEVVSDTIEGELMGGVER